MRDDTNNETHARKLAEVVESLKRRAMRKRQAQGHYLSTFETPASLTGPSGRPPCGGNSHPGISGGANFAKGYDLP